MENGDGFVQWVIVMLLLILKRMPGIVVWFDLASGSIVVDITNVDVNDSMVEVNGH